MSMSLEQVAHLLRGKASIIDAATAMGAQLLEDQDLRQAASSSEFAAEMRSVEAACAATTAAPWIESRAAPDLAVALTTASANADALSKSLERLGMVPELLLIALVRGLCAGPLLRHYDSCDEVVRLRRGTPFPMPRREAQLVFGRGNTTPNPSTLNPHHPLTGTRFRLCPVETFDTTRVELDFSCADAIDACTWDDTDDLAPVIPPVATVHPYESGSELSIGFISAIAFFDVRPVAWDENSVLEQLRTAKRAGARIAVIPELTLDQPDSLETGLAMNREDVPRIVVAGSAHVTIEGERRNEAHVYIDGACVATHKKIRPFVARSLPVEVTHALDPADRSGPWTEDLTSEPKTIKILSGRDGRLATVICADFNDPAIVSALSMSGVNQLLVPALTTDQGAFAQHAGQLAAAGQAVVVVANGTLATDDASSDLFLTLASTPVKEAAAQSYAPTGSRRAVVLISFADSPPVSFASA
ncbi:MAG: hypothetical protein J7513_13010 [Solirubrobacteraceae bacterium]|nr:hypothetical protein [Solirubrobacteraceae bacterium]